jgi:hypothetical protein
VAHGDFGHFGQILIEQVCQLLGFETVRGLGEIGDVREEDRQFLPLGRDSVVCVPVKIELYNWGGRNLANLDDSWARSSFFSVSSICVRLRLDKSGGDGDHSEQNDQPAEIAMESAHKRHRFLHRRYGGQDVHGHEISKIKQTHRKQS